MPKRSARTQKGRVRKQLPVSPDSLKLSEVTDSYWLDTERKIGAYPDHTENGGKWLIFVPVSQVDEVWEKIKRATEEGKLGGELRGQYTEIDK